MTQASPAHRSFSHSAVSGPWAVLVLVGLLLAGYAPLLFRFATEQWDRSQYAFFPVMILAALYLGWQRMAELSTERRQPAPAAGLAGMLLVLALLVGASLLWSGRLAAVSAWLAMGVLAWQWAGGAGLVALAPSAILLALVIGPPLGLDEAILVRLRELAVWASGRILEWLAVPHRITGTVIIVPGARLLVAEACSGINSLMASLGFALVWCFWWRRGAWLSVMLVTAVFPLVLWANIVRIVLGAWLKTGHGLDILSGDAHQMASMVLFAVCLLVILSADELLQAIVTWWRPPEEPVPVDVVWMADARRKQTPPSSALHMPHTRQRGIGAGLWAVASLFAMLGAAQVAYASTHGGLRVWMNNAGTCHLRGDAIFTAPDQIGPWRRAKEIEAHLAPPEIEGKQSRMWAYRMGDRTAILAIDYPFAGLHDLTVCYRNVGWTLDGVTCRDESGTGPYLSARFTRMTAWGYLCYAAFGEDGRWLAPPADDPAWQFGSRLRHVGRPDWNACTYQVQVWANGYDPLSDAEQAQLTLLLLGARWTLSQQVLSQLEGRQ